MLFGQSGRHFHGMYRFLPIYWVRISIWEKDIGLIHFFVVSCLGKDLPTADPFFKKNWQIFTRRMRRTGYGVQWSALASSAPEIHKCTARKPYPYKQRQLSFCSNIIKFLWKLTVLWNVFLYILSDKCRYFGGTFCVMCSTEDEGSKLTCTISHSLATILMGTALRTLSLVYFVFVICVKRPLTPDF